MTLVMAPRGRQQHAGDALVFLGCPATVGQSGSVAWQASVRDIEVIQDA